MKIRMIKKATVFLMALTLVLSTATGAFAVAYYEAGTYDYSSGNASMNMGNSTPLTPLTGTRQLNFYNNAQLVLGPNTDANLVNAGLFQYITGTYNLTYVSGGITTGIYSLALVSGTKSTLTVDTMYHDDLQLSATTKAMSINFTDNTITWDTVTMGLIPNTVNSSSLADMQTLKDSNGTFGFTTFAFQHTAAVDAWLSSGTSNQTYYYSQLGGVSAAPEPAEWVLMFIGLGMLGFYLQRRGYLNFDLSPQSVA